MKEGLKEDRQKEGKREKDAKNGGKERGKLRKESDKKLRKDKAI